MLATQAKPRLGYRLRFDGCDPRLLQQVQAGYQRFHLVRRSVSALFLIMASGCLLLNVDQAAFGATAADKKEKPASAAKASKQNSKSKSKSGSDKGSNKTDKAKGDDDKSAKQANADADKNKDEAYTGPPVLDPGKFYGAAAMGYASAKAAPQVMAKLFCYCGCDISDAHSYLIDCFTSIHGVDCHICQEEAVLALRMHRDGASISDIQKRVDQEYSKQYPFTEDSPAYTKYKATRLWTKPEPTATKPSGDWKPVVKPGMSVGECCSKDEHSADKKK